MTKIKADQVKSCVTTIDVLVLLNSSALNSPLLFYSFLLCIRFSIDANYSFNMPTGDLPLLDYTEIDQGLNLWSEIFPMIEKQIGTLTTVAQEMQECPGKMLTIEF